MIAIAPVFGVVVQASLAESSARVERAEASLRSMVQLGAAQQERFIEGARQVLAAVAYAPPVYQGDAQACSAYMRRLQNQYPSGFGIFGVLDPQGNLTCRATPPATPVNSSDRLFFRNALKTGRFSVGEFTISRASGRPVLTFGLPVYADEARSQLRGVAYLALDLTQADAQLRRLALAPEMTMLVSDGNGTVMAAAGPRAGRIGVPLPEEFLRGAVTANRPGFAHETGADGERWLYAVQPTGGGSEGRLYVAAMMSSADLLASSTRRLHVQLAALALIALAAAVAAWLFGDRVVAGPISRTLARIEALRRNEVAAPDAAPSGLKELRVLDESFEEMARSLSARAVLRDAALSELAGQKTLLESILESMAEGVLVLDNAGRFIHINSAAHRILPGLSEMNRQGSQLRPAEGDWGIYELDGSTPLPHEGRPALRALAGQTMDHFRLVVRGRLSGGAEKIIQGDTRELRAPEGTRDGVVVVFSDITAAYRAEQAVLQMNDTLERRVAERTRELALSNSELESFAYSVSHDLRAPLQVIDGFSRSLVARCGESLDEKGRHYLSRIRENTRQMGELIDDLLSLARVTRTELRTEPLNLAPRAAQAVERLRQRFPLREVAVEIDDDMRCTGDVRLLAIVLENLLENAWKFTARTPDARIRVGRKPAGAGECVIYVADNGAGFDMAYADKLFQPFQRLHAATDFEGTGIGLATVHRVVTRHGGRVWAEARPGEGATFLFTLKSGAVDESQQPHPPGGGQPGPPGAHPDDTGGEQRPQ
ncbi:sensor histidine kinase [Caenimonas aquaedulcis]|uniref:histidine kinase n=1 Tax=Caenimonas aquaedulcis TaxID=2793270 RepID=A0A931H1F8_9BURK|nr:ATP-binding protein [Caenimonas aquaedulcis]MBG9386796.1 PAS domain-containing protein [Caenimonas aquaedulcis]